MKDKKSLLSKSKMRIVLKTFILVSIISLPVILHAQITVKADNESIRSILKKIEKQSDMTFFYNEALTDLNKKVSVKVSNLSIESTLNKLLKNTGLAYSIQETTIVLTDKNKIAPTSETITPQNTSTDKGRKVSGVVKDINGETLIGVAVAIRGSNNRVATNGKGEFELQNVPPDATLDISYVGMKSQSVSLAGKTILTVVLSDDTKLLEEVVVTAMGIERKSKSLTYATQR